MIDITPASRAMAAARRVPQTFECRPTAVGLAADVLPDELMIDWRALPRGTSASIYLPAVGADPILAMAEKLYGGQSLVRVDGDTIGLAASGVSYVPIPPGPGGNYAGLLTIELPEGALERRQYGVTVRQVTNVSTERDDRTGRTRRRVRGAFQLTAPVRPAETLLVREQRRLAFFRWVLGGLDLANRWHPVMKRFVHELALRVDGLGGDAGAIGASSIGALPGEHAGSGGGAGGIEHEWRGKIEDLIFDQFGDFEAFRMKTETGQFKTFRSREEEFAALVERAWHARLRVTVVTSKHHPDMPLRILLHPPIKGEWA